MARLVGILAALGLVTATAHARPRDVMVYEPQASAQRAPAATPPYNTIFLNRCASGCVIHSGTTNSTTDTSSIVPSGTHDLTAFPYSDDVWNQVVDCVKDTFATFNVQITDVDPGTADHFEIMIAGKPGDVGLAGNYGGVSPYNCAVPYIPDSLVFDFASVWNGDVEEICSTAAQEIAHSFTLDHVTLASDPMTYFSYPSRRYFTNGQVQCGSDCVNGVSPFNLTCSGTGGQNHACTCGGSQTQDSVQTITALFGALALAPPTVAIANPADGAEVAPGFNVTATATAENNAPIAMVELSIDGTVESPTLTSMPYAFSAPADIASGSHTVQVTAYDGRGSTNSATITVVVSGPCTKASDCPTATDVCIGGQCVAGPGAAGGLGASCTSNSQCGVECGNDGTTQVCTAPCTKGECPSGFGCDPTGGPDGAGVCWPGYDDGSGGGCSTGATGGSLTLGLAGAALALGRRRKRRP